MRSAWLVVPVMVAFGGVVRAEGLPPPIAVKHVGAPSATADRHPAWKLLMPSGSTWCQATPGTSPGEPLTITLAAPTALSSIEVTPMNDSAANTISTVEVMADDKPFKGTRGKDARGIDVKLSGAAVTRLVVRVTASMKGSRDANCISDVQLHMTPDAVVVYGVDPAAAAALWPSVQAIKDALASCSSKALAAQLAFPLVRNWYTMDNDGMKERSATYKTSAAAVKACKAKKLRGEIASMKLVEPRVDSLGDGTLDVSEEGTTWHLELDGGRWRVRSFSMGG